MRTISTLLVMVVLAGSATLWAADGDLPGGGTEGDPYLIEDLADFDVFSSYPNYWASGVRTKLMCDPNLADRTYTTAVIAPDTPDTDRYFNGVPFEGIFDGDGHVINNLTIDTGGAGNDYLGLFGRIESSSAEVKNLVMEGINIAGGDGSYSLGGLCGYIRGTISNCYSSGSVTGGDDSHNLGGLCGANGGTISNCHSGGSVTGGDESYLLGGLCGQNRHGTISNCYATGSVTGWEVSERLGGLCGSNGGTITRCYSGGSVTGEDSSYSLGGLCGENWLGTISNCYATCSVTGGAALGGLCGVNYGGINSGTINNCFSGGSVSGWDDLGGVCGENWGSIRNSYWNTESSGIETSAGGEGKTTSQLQQQSTFTDWDFINVWNIGENQTYPYIRTYLASDINKDRITNFGDLCIVAGEWMRED